MNNFFFSYSDRKMLLYTIKISDLEYEAANRLNLKNYQVNIMYVEYIDSIFVK